MHEDNKIPFLLTIPLGIVCVVLLIMVRVRDVRIRWMREDQAAMDHHFETALSNWDNWRQRAEAWRAYARTLEKKIEVRERHFTGSQVEIKNACFACYVNFRADSGVSFDEMLESCHNPLQRADVQWCFSEYGRSSCSRENTTTCMDLLVCHSGKWELHCDEASLHEG